ncbi:hypothetical protein HMPREF0058_0724 [Actinomyces urogenitalis DSM 15434]|uniref:Lipoprotein n=1 Tax=Actinomyces urogenitalis DSM 15434 TaxID=525246 RepID=C0W4D0_9ACTO|nr:hypothetical protein HMPREF0058_0724 [Actinomyces urogenitalis DSM 15434]
MKLIGLSIFLLAGLAGCLAAVLGGVSNPACLVGMGAGLAVMWLADLPTTESTHSSTDYDSQKGAHR